MLTGEARRSCSPATSTCTAEEFADPDTLHAELVARSTVARPEPAALRPPTMYYGLEAASRSWTPRCACDAALPAGVEAQVRRAPRRRCCVRRSRHGSVRPPLARQGAVRRRLGAGEGGGGGGGGGGGRARRSPPLPRRRRPRRARRTPRPPPSSTAGRSQRRGDRSTTAPGAALRRRAPGRDPGRLRRRLTRPAGHVSPIGIPEPSSDGGSSADPTAGSPRTGTSGTGPRVGPSASPPGHRLRPAVPGGEGGRRWRRARRRSAARRP